MASKQSALTLSKKLEMIAAVEKNDREKTRTKTQIAQDFGIPKTTSSTIIKNKEKTKDAFEQSKFDPQRKRLRAAAFENVEEALVRWIGQARSMNVPLSGPILLEKADSLAQKLGCSDFKCSSGWLERFKSRHGIKFKHIVGESSTVTSAITHEWTSVAFLLCYLNLPLTTYTMLMKLGCFTNAHQRKHLR